MKIKFLEDVGFAYKGYIGDYDDLTANKLIQEKKAELVEDTKEAGITKFFTNKENV